MLASYCNRKRRQQRQQQTYATNSNLVAAVSAISPVRNNENRHSVEMVVIPTTSARPISTPPAYAPPQNPGLLLYFIFTFILWVKIYCSLLML